MDGQTLWWTDRDTTKLEVPFHVFTNLPKKRANQAVSDTVYRLNQEVPYCQNSYRFTVHAEMKRPSLRQSSRNSQILDVITKRHISIFAERSIYVEDKIYLPH